MDLKDGEKGWGKQRFYLEDHFSVRKKTSRVKVLTFSSFLKLLSFPFWKFNNTGSFLNSISNSAGLAADCYLRVAVMCSHLPFSVQKQNMALRLRIKGQRDCPNLEPQINAPCVMIIRLSFFLESKMFFLFAYLHEHI